MYEQAATAARGRTSARSHKQTDWRFTDEQTLISGMLANNDFAWLEFLRRFDALFTARIKMRMSRWNPKLHSTALIEEIKGDIHDALSANDMRPLRAFDPRHGTFSAWLCRIADHATMRRLTTLTTLDEEE